MIGQDGVGESVYTCPVESFAEKLVCDVRRVFVWGDMPENPWNHLKQTLKSKPVAERVVKSNAYYCKKRPPTRISC